MRLLALLAILSIAWLVTLAGAEEPKPDRVIRPSPDGKHYVGWFDHDDGEPIGLVRAVVFRDATDPYDIFSFVSTPRATDAAWNAASNRCIIADAPDNGGPKTWLLTQKSESDWTMQALDPFASLYEAFRKDNSHKSSLFRPSILRITWLTETQVRFRGYCYIGTYLITMDVTDLKQPPLTEKLSDKFLEE